MSFCKQSVHSFLGFNNSMETAAVYSSYEFDNKTPYKQGLGLITATGDSYRLPNVIESSVAKLLPLPPTPTPVTVFSRKDLGGMGFIDDIDGGVDGLMSRTESLGFESSDERIVDDHHMEVDGRTESSSSRAKWRKDHLGAEKSRGIKKFPPPLSSFNSNGQPSFFLRSVRTDGRLELTEVRIDRSEILRASREDGRLRLHLIIEEECDTVEQEYKHEDEHEQQQQQIPHQEAEAEAEDEEEEEEEEEEDVEEEEEEEEEDIVGDPWKFQVSGEGFRRCTELMNHDYHHHPHHQNISHHHNLHVWSQHCVPTR